MDQWLKTLAVLREDPGLNSSTWWLTTVCPPVSGDLIVSSDLCRYHT